MGPGSSVWLVNLAQNLWALLNLEAEETRGTAVQDSHCCSSKMHTWSCTHLWERPSQGNSHSAQETELCNVCRQPEERGFVLRSQCQQDHWFWVFLASSMTDTTKEGAAGRTADALLLVLGCTGMHEPDRVTLASNTDTSTKNDLKQEEVRSITESAADRSQLLLSVFQPPGNQVTGLLQESPKIMCFTSGVSLQKLGLFPRMWKGKKKI
ncbi:uncharacterized protein LOC130257004 [Oenanthe melanoleuca]|uniref:uncharacterized protein LOC130257004 n=1 Tax=Oenanthe melanoleuca TaxID=2939378 RepID=UPI0024C0F7D1|nr:uncharacterized protein LOC130257004 [Oenanthe melanoleuca]